MAAQQRGCGLVPPQLLMLFLLPPLPPSIDPMKRMQAHRIAGSAKWWALPLLEAKQQCINAGAGAGYRVAGILKHATCTLLWLSHL